MTLNKVDCLETRETIAVYPLNNTKQPIGQKVKILITMLLVTIPSSIHAHPGGLNLEGCHTNKATGEYHCHKKMNAPPITIQPISIIPVAKPTTKIQTGRILEIDYDGFIVWLDCKRHGAIKFRYNTQKDTGNAKRLDTFFLDPKVPSECQQTTAKAYGSQYDRGHLVPANHLDNSDTAIRETNTMTNILPQVASMNRGAWLLTEEIIECYRDIDKLLIIGGVIWGNNSEDDYFLQSHGVATPDAFWKVIIRGKGQDERAIAWVIPNSPDAKRKNLDGYLVTVDEIERITGEKIPVADYEKHNKPSASWLIPRGCNKS